MKIEEVKRNLNEMVTSDGKKDIYKLTGCIIRKKENGEFYYQAELLDTKHGNSLLYCKLEDITEKQYLE